MSKNEYEIGDAKIQQGQRHGPMWAFPILIQLPTPGKRTFALAFGELLQGA